MVGRLGLRGELWRLVVMVACVLTSFEATAQEVQKGPFTLHERAVSVEVPEGWTLEPQPLGEGVEALFVIARHPINSSVSIGLFQTDVPHAEMLDGLASIWRNARFKVERGEPVESFAGLEGVGERGVIRERNGESRYVWMLKDLDGSWRLQVQCGAYEGALDDALPAIERIVRSIEVRSPDTIAPVTDEPSRHDLGLIAVDYPANWRPYAGEGGVSLSNVMVEMPQDGFVRFDVYPTTLPINEELISTKAMHASLGFRFGEGRAIDQLGSRGGEGMRWPVLGDDAEATHWFEALAWDLGDGFRAEARVMTPVGREDLVRPGVELMMSSINAVRPDQATPSVAEPLDIELPWIRFESPSNWSVESPVESAIPMVFVGSPQDSAIVLAWIEGESTAKKALSHPSIASWGPPVMGVSDQASIDRLGLMTGVGERWTTGDDAGEVEVVRFATSTGGGVLVIATVAPTNFAELVKPGVELVLGSLDVGLVDGGEGAEADEPAPSKPRF